MKSRHNVAAAAVLGILVIGAVWATGFVLPASAGFPAIEALFSGLAFWGVICALWLQRKELQLQRQELADTREEMRGQKEQLAEQNKSLIQQNITLVQQNFDERFFHLLRLHNDIVKAIEFREFKGRDCFEPFYTELKKILDQGSGDRPEAIDNAFKQFMVDHEADLGHYFRGLYNLVKLVDKSAVPDKRFYTNLIRAQLSRYEFLLLFYDCLSGSGKKRFKELIERYSFLKTLTLKELHREGDKDLFTAEAYR